MPFTRRTFLKSAALTTAAASLSPTLVALANTSLTRPFRFRLLHRHPHPARTRRRPRLRHVLPQNRHHQIRFRHHGRRPRFRRRSASIATRATNGLRSLRPRRANSSACRSTTHRQPRRLRRQHRSGVSPTDPAYGKKMYRTAWANLLLLRPQGLALRSPRFDPAHRRSPLGSPHRSQPSSRGCKDDLQRTAPDTPVIVSDPRPARHCLRHLRGVSRSRPARNTTQ